VFGSVNFEPVLCVCVRYDGLGTTLVLELVYHDSVASCSNITDVPVLFQLKKHSFVYVLLVVTHTYIFPFKEIVFSENLICIKIYNFILWFFI